MLDLCWAIFHHLLLNRTSTHSQKFDNILYTTNRTEQKKGRKNRPTDDDDDNDSDSDDNVLSKVLYM